MVIAFHPGGMSAQYMQGRVPVHRVWPEAIAVFPEGFPNMDGGRGGLQPVWQRAPGDMADRDLVYFDQMIEWLRANHCYDAKKLFVMGYSNGAGFTSVLACERASLIAGVAIASGRLACAPAEPKPIIFSHGLSDATIPYNNGVEAAAAWSSRNKCGSPPKARAPGCFAADSCSDAPVTMCTFGGGHEYNDPFTEDVCRFLQAIDGQVNTGRRVESSELRRSAHHQCRDIVGRSDRAADFRRRRERHERDLVRIVDAL